jgi:hypothetical protein
LSRDSEQCRSLRVSKGVTSKLSVTLLLARDVIKTVYPDVGLESITMKIFFSYKEPFRDFASLTS